MSWNASSPQVPGIYGSVGSGDAIGISFQPTTDTIAGFSFDFVDWNDGGERSYFIVIASDGTETIVSGPANAWDAPPQNFAATLSAADIAEGKYIQEIRLVGVAPDGSEVVGFYNFRLLSNPLLDSAPSDTPSALGASTAMRNRPALGAAVVVDATETLFGQFSDAGLATDGEVSAAVSQTLPLLEGGSLVASRHALEDIQRVVQARFDEPRGPAFGDATASDRRFWFKAFGSRADQDRQQSVSGYEAATSGAVFGVDTTPDEFTRLGVAFGYGRADVDGDDAMSSQSLDADVYSLLVYGSHPVLDERTLIDARLGVGWHRNEGRRGIAIASSVASADYDSVSTSVGVGLSRAYELGERTKLIPSLRADYLWIRDEGYRESGAGEFNLRVSSRSSDALVLGVDAKLSRELTPNTTLMANAGLGYDSLAYGSSVTASYAGGGAAFRTRGIDPEPWLGRAGLGLVSVVNRDLELTLRYDAELREDFLQQTATLKLLWSF